MSRWFPRTLLLGGGVAVLVLGAAANGFEPSLAGVSAPTTTEPASTEPAPPRRGLALPVSVVALLVDRADSSAAVVLRVVNPNPRLALTDAPVAIDLLDRAGKVVGSSAAAGTDPRLVRIPYIEPGKSALFVNDTIAASAVPVRARATATATFSAIPRARLGVRAPRLRTSSFGSVAAGLLASSGTTRPRNVLVQAVVHDGERIAAAGTTLVPAPPLGRPASFEILLVGDANRGDLRVWAPPQ